MANQLQGETSPYLLQHADNPVDWHPWGKAAFDKARAEDKPIFLSIGYSTCHWCHVMAKESFSDRAVAKRLNRSFVSIKVDREERPDIDSIYMAFCQAFTGSGGWPMSVFLTAEQKPFFAGTYFPKTTLGGMIGFMELLDAIETAWRTDRAGLLRSADGIEEVLRRESVAATEAEDSILQLALHQYRETFDPVCGGFGRAPKFPAAHNLLFLLTMAQSKQDGEALLMAETTLRQMYLGGIFDHIGYGFCRYSTDRQFLKPHFEKMLYDNALLLLAYAKAYEVTKKPLYLEVAEKIADYVLREMTSPDGAFFSAQDADSDGVEGGYYVFEPSELIALLGEENGSAFNRRFGIAKPGNFGSKSIPNLLHADSIDGAFDQFLPAIRSYRAKRAHLVTDDKILTAWNALMIAALCALYRVSRDSTYLQAAKRAERFLAASLSTQDTLFVSYRDFKHGREGFLDDYAYMIYALLGLYHATTEHEYLDRALTLVHKTVADFFDETAGGFFLYSVKSEALILHPKETDDGALPSGNAVMAFNLVQLSALTQEETLAQLTKQQLDFLFAAAKRYPMGHAMTLLALAAFFDPPPHVTAVCREKEDVRALPFLLPLGATARILPQPAEGYPLKDGKTTYYICALKRCLPPLNDPAEALRAGAPLPPP